MKILKSVIKQLHPFLFVTLLAVGSVFLMSQLFHNKKLPHEDKVIAQVDYGISQFN